MCDGEPQESGLGETAGHNSVLLEASLDALAPVGDGLYVDATFGRGGHSRAILSRLGRGGRLLAIDRDPAAIEAGAGLAASDSRIELVHARFDAIGALLDARGWAGRVDGILFDLGVSSPQLDDPQRGFSFLRDGPLDMRMNPDEGISAAEWLAVASENEIASVLRNYGEERYARRMARALVTRRAERAITTTGELARLIADANPAWERGKHPATRAFQAIRIEINNELEVLKSALAESIDGLGPGGRLVVISFHSLEDRIVKRMLRDHSRPRDLPPGVALPESQLVTRLRRLARPVRPDAAEVAANPRARSAVLRMAERNR